MSNAPYLIGTGSGTGNVLTLSPAGTSAAIGDAILIGIQMTSAGTVTLITDDAGNPYSQVAQDEIETGESLSVWACYNSNGLTTSSQKIYVTFSGSVTAGAVIVGDNNVSGSDQAVTAHGSSTTPSVSWATLAQKEEHLIAFLVTNAAAPGTPSGWTALGNGGSSGQQDIAVYKDVTATTSGSVSWTIASDPWTAILITNEVNLPSVSTVLSSGILTEAYSQTFAGAGGSLSGYTYAITSGSLPGGLSLSSGVISGTPTASGVFSFTVTTTDGAGMTGTTAMSITILANGASGATAIGNIPGNIISPADADSESATAYTWTPGTGTTSSSRSSVISLTGSHCTSWIRTTTGTATCQLETGQYTCLPEHVLPLAGYRAPGQRAAGPVRDRRELVHLRGRLPDRLDRLRHDDLHARGLRRVDSRLRHAGLAEQRGRYGDRRQQRHRQRG